MKTNNNDSKGEINMNNTTVQIFEGNKVEVFELNGQVLFNPYDVGNCLDLNEVTIRRHIQTMNEKQVVKLKNSNVQEMNFRKLHNTGENFLTESGVYKLIFKSNKPNAERFQDWVTDEVLPSIRKHGAYLTPQKIEEVLFNPDTIIQLATNLKNEQEKNKKLQEENIILIEKNEQQEILIDELQEENQEMKPKSIYCDKVLQSDGLITITQIAKDYGYSGKEFNKILHNFKIQYKQGNIWLLYAKYQDKGYTYSKTYINENNKSFINTQWTQKGRLFLYEFLKECGILPLIERNENEDDN